MSRSRAVLVVAYGAPDLLRDALAPLSAERVIVVDNSSRSDTRELVEQLGHAYIDSGGNLGFAGGVNVGFGHLAESGFVGDVLLLNPDAVIESAAIDVLQAAMLASEDLAAVAPVLVLPDGQRQLTKYPLPSPAQVWRFTFHLPVGRHAVDFVIGAALLLRAEAIADVGEFDERFFLYGEEADWQRRAFERGWRAAEIDGAVAVHHVGGSSDTDRLRVVRVSAGQETYLRVWYGTRGWTSYRIAGWIASMIRALPGVWLTAGVRARVFRLGPRRVAALPPPPRGLAILHIARKPQLPADLVTLASKQAAAGHSVTVLTRNATPVIAADVTWRQASSSRQAVRAVWSTSPHDVVHAWDAGAVSLACVTGPAHGGRVVTSGRTTVLGRLGAAVFRGRIDVAVPSETSLDTVDDYRALVAANVRPKTDIA